MFRSKPRLLGLDPSLHWDVTAESPTKFTQRCLFPSGGRTHVDQEAVLWYISLSSMCFSLTLCDISVYMNLTLTLTPCKLFLSNKMVDGSHGSLTDLCCHGDARLRCYDDHLDLACLFSKVCSGAMSVFRHGSYIFLTPPLPQLFSIVDPHCPPCTTLFIDLYIEILFCIVHSLVSWL